jgi:hypothetical protein
LRTKRDSSRLFSSLMMTKLGLFFSCCADMFWVVSMYNHWCFREQVSVLGWSVSLGRFVRFKLLFHGAVLLKVFSAEKVYLTPELSASV